MRPRSAIVAAVALGALAVAFASPPAAARRPAVRVPIEFAIEISPNRGTTSDTFIATVRILLPGVNGPDLYGEPDLNEFTVVDSQLQETSLDIVDAQDGKQMQYLMVRRYYLQPRRAGHLRIGAATIRVDRVDYESNPAVVDVTAAPAGAAPPAGLPSIVEPNSIGGVDVPGYTAPVLPEPGASPDDATPIFIHAVADKQRLRVGEQVTVTWILFSRTDYDYNPRPPALDNLWSETLFEPSGPLVRQSALIGKRIYDAAILSKRALFPTRPGTIEVGPFAAAVSLLDAPAGQVTNVRSPTLSLTVDPLPPGAPTGFDDTYVGHFEVAAAIDRNQVRAGESLLLDLTVRGQGNLRRTAPPALDLDGFTVRPVRDFEEKLDLTGGVVGGSRTYHYWLTPQLGGPQSIPPIRIPYFDPASGAYAEAVSQPISFLVEGDPSQVAGADRDHVIARDIRLIRSGDSIDSDEPVPPHHRAWFWILAALPPLGFAAFVAAQRVSRRLHADTLAARMRRARGRARRRFRDAEALIEAGRPADFFAALDRIIDDYLEQRLGRPVHSLTRDELTAALTEAGLEGDVRAAVHRELDACDAARFAPHAAGADEMRAAWARVEALLQRIERALPAAALCFAIGLGLALGLGAAVARAETPAGPADYGAANRAYAAGDFTAALASYEALVAAGVVHRDLYFNLGSAYYRAGKLGPSIYNFERALRLDPGFADARYDLEVAHATVADRVVDRVVDAEREPWPRRAATALGPGALVAILLAADLLFFLGLVGLRLTPRPRRGEPAAGRAALRIATIACGLLLLGACTLLAARVHYLERRVTGIVLPDQLPLREAADAGSAPRTPVHAGLRVDIVRRETGWVQVRLANGAEGWAPASAIGEL